MNHVTQENNQEFATVMLYNRRKGRRDVKPNVLAEKLFKLFDKEGCGSIDVDDMLEQIQQMGKNWDMADVRAFLDEIDNDGSGCIVKSDFISYVEKYMGEQRWFLNRSHIPQLSRPRMETSHSDQPRTGRFPIFSIAW